MDSVSKEISEIKKRREQTQAQLERLKEQLENGVEARPKASRRAPSKTMRTRKP